MPLSGAVVRAMLTFDPTKNGLLYQRMPMPRLASAVEALLYPTKPPSRLIDEVTAAFAAPIQPTAAVRSVLFRPAALRDTGGAVELPHVVLALLQGELGARLSPEPFRDAGRGGDTTEPSDRAGLASLRHPCLRRNAR